MLVLSRRGGQTVVIGGGIVVTVVEVRDGRVRLGFDAPRDVPVNRGEVAARIAAEAEAIAPFQPAEPEESPR